MRNFFRMLKARFSRKPLPADPFGEPGPGFAPSETDRDLKGAKFARSAQWFG
jgi:hypothetical protein